MQVNDWLKRCKPLLFVASKISASLFFFSKLPGEIEQNNWKERGGGCVSSNWELHVICAQKISPVLLTLITPCVCKGFQACVSLFLHCFCNCSNMQTPKWRPGHVTVSSHLLCACAVHFSQDWADHLCSFFEGGKERTDSWLVVLEPIELHVAVTWMQWIYCCLYRWLLMIDDRLHCKNK